MLFSNVVFKGCTLVFMFHRSLTNWKISFIYLSLETINNLIRRMMNWFEHNFLFVSFI